MKINLQSRKRRELADHIGEVLGVIPHYLGVPTCNYQIGDCILECDGTLIIPSNIDSTALLNHLKERGWESGETDRKEWEQLREPTMKNTPFAVFYCGLV